jgi:hypothetical protein
MVSYRFAEFVDDKPTGTICETDSPSLAAAIIDIAGLTLEDEATGGIVLAEYDFAPPYVVRFDNIEYRLLHGPRA